MNGLLFNLGADTGGVLSGIVHAFRNDPEWRVRSFVLTPNYIRYPMDLRPTKSVLLKEWDLADVVHLHHDFRSFEKAYKVAEKILPAKPFVIEYHGTGFREFSEYHLVEQRYFNAVGVVSTLDLWLLAPTELEWLPTPMDVEKLKRMKQPDDGTIVIAHAPTDRTIKSTKQLIEAVDKLQREGFDVELDIIEHRPWKECLERKAKADIYFDQVILGYGCNALEAWSMGIPVVAGAQDDTLDEMERRFGQLPFYHATEETIYDAVKELLEYPGLRQRYAQIGHDYVRKYHDEPVVVEQLKRIYQRAIDQSMEEAA